jgi:glutathione S-transferase
MLKIYGVPFSAHTRKVIVAALEKEIPYELVPIIPLTPPPGWAELSPLGHIPVVEVDGEVIRDSSVICQYLERTHPGHSIYPADPKQFARALWIEEFIDSGLAPHVLRGLLLQRVFAPKFLKQPPDEALIQTSLTKMIPARFAYLEQCLTGDYLAGNAFSIADITVASMLINFHYAGEQIDATRYPKLRHYLQQILTRRCFQRAFATERPAAESIGDLDMSLLQGNR